MDLKIPMYPQFDDTVIMHPLFDDTVIVHPLFDDTVIVHPLFNDTVIEAGSWPLLTGEVRPIEAPALTPHWFTVKGLF